MQEEPSTSRSFSPHSLNHVLLILAITILIVLIIGTIFYLVTFREDFYQAPVTSSPPSLAPQPVEQPPQALTPSVPDITPPAQIINPIETLPQTNPFETQTNPFENAYRNPFE